MGSTYIDWCFLALKERHGFKDGLQASTYASKEWLRKGQKRMNIRITLRSVLEVCFCRESA